ncbi:hypothetical protein [Sulfurimonas hydrogeniphila]|uniref:hypothetical protein n=1 Tax=Sulfurimonas hydrogeniphila TaxID=2509341 RepID=UPI00125FF7D5|nr:hypothetical protein [Sulfurimonas hydrogeniphila]
MNDIIEISTKDTLVDGNGIRSMRKFLHSTIELFAEESLEFYKHWGEFPFIYGEKQVNSVIIPAIHKYTGNIWLEQPFKKAKNNQRFLDIATTKGNNIYLIELKHSFNSKNNAIAKYTDSEWEKAIEQISDINRKTIGDYFNYEEFNVFKIALMIMPTYLFSDKKHSILDMKAHDYVNKLFQEYECYNAEKYRANFIGTMKFIDPVVYKHEFINGNRIYPFVSFIARIEEI